MLKLFRQVVIVLLLAGAGYVLLFGPRPNAALPKDAVVIEYWEKWSGPEGERMREIVDDFNATVGIEKGIFVRFLSISSVDRKTLLAIAAGVPPDVAGLWDRQLVQYAAIGAIEPLDDLAREYGIGPDTYKPVYWKGINYDGKLWGLVSAGWVVALHYNKLAFAEAGLDPEAPPRTIAELDEMAKRFERWNGSKLERCGFLPTEPDWYVNQMPIWFGGRLFDPETKRFTLLEPETVRAFEWVRSYSRRLGAQAISDFQSGQAEGVDVARNHFLTGGIVMQQQGPWLANYIRRYRPADSPFATAPTPPGELPPLRSLDDWGAAPFPPADPSLTDAAYAGFDTLVIPRGAKHKREAFEFMAYLSRQDVIERLAKAHCKNSPLKNVSEDFLSDHPNPNVEVFERLASSPNAHSLPQVPTWPEANEDLIAMVQSIAGQRQTVDEALRQTQARLQASYDRFMAVQAAREEDEAEIRERGGSQNGGMTKE